MDPDRVSLLAGLGVLVAGCGVTALGVRRGINRTMAQEMNRNNKKPGLGRRSMPKQKAPTPEEMNRMRGLAKRAVMYGTFGAVVAVSSSLVAACLLLGVKTVRIPTAKHLHSEKNMLPSIL